MNANFQKKRFPIKIIFLVGLVLLLALLLFFAVNFKFGKGKDLVGKKGEIIWWGLNFEESDLSTLIKEYQEKNPEIQITYIKQSPIDYRERLTNALASGTGPDIFELHSSWPPMFSNDLSALPGSVMSSDEFKSLFYPVVSVDLALSKGIIGIPLEYDALTLFINEDIFGSAAKTPPKTWDELRDLSFIFTQRGEGGKMIQSGIPLGMAENIDYWPEVIAFMIFQNQGNPSFPSGFSTQRALEYYKQFGAARVWDSSLPRSTTAFARGMVAMYFAPARAASEILKQNPDLNFKTILLPQLPKERPTDPDFSYATYWFHGVWERSRNKDAAWSYLKFMASKESLEKLNQNVKQRTGFERPSPRIDMAELFSKNPVLGSVVNLALKAKSWYLADNTHDGETGINSQFKNIYSELIDPKTNKYPTPNMADPDIAEILGKYKIPAVR